MRALDKKKILIVDDSVTVRQQIRIALTAGGFSTVEAVNGLEGIARLTSDLQIAAVVCDVNMDRMTGLEMLRELKDSNHRRVPVIMLTTERNPVLIAEAKAAGAAGWMVKQFNPESLVTALKKLTNA